DGGRGEVGASGDVALLARLFAAPRGGGFGFVAVIVCHSLLFAICDLQLKSGEHPFLQIANRKSQIANHPDCPARAAAPGAVHSTCTFRIARSISRPSRSPVRLRPSHTTMMPTIDRRLRAADMTFICGIVLPIRPSTM